MNTPAIQFSGLATGIDTGSLIEALVGVQRIPILRLQNRQAVLQSRSSTLGTFLSRLDSLEAAANGLKKGTDINATQATISDDEFLSVTSSGVASPGVHSIEVVQLAQIEKEVSQGFADVNDTALGSGRLSIDVGGTVTDIDLTDATLGDVKDAINSSDAEVTASIINDGSGTPYRLVVTGKEGGLGNTISFSGDFSPFTFSEVQAADDAIINVDTIEVRSSTNVVEDVIEGVTLNLKQAGSGSLDMTVSTDTAGVKNNLQGFVDAYNDVIGYINSQTSFDEASGRAGSLLGDFTTSLVERRLQSTVTGSISGASGTFSALSQIGITTQADGTLALNEGDLTDAVTEDIQGVLSLFVEGEGDLSGTLESFLSEATESRTGLVPSRQDAMQRSIEDLQKRIDNSERFVERFRENLVRRYASLERLIGGLNSQASSLASLQ